LKTYELKENYDESALETKIFREINERIIRSLLDVIVLAKLRNRSALLGGYDVIELIHQEYNILISSGTVYAVLYSMERDGLIEAKATGRKRAYVLTEKGENKIKEISALKTNIVESLTKIFV
jgi:DNA-binding PadR family transcriptional regulator